MELVTIASATLSRVGSATSSGFTPNREVSQTSEVPDASIDSLRNFVISIAEANGESRASLSDLQQDNSRYYQGNINEVVFNIQGKNVQYSNAYALCVAFPALKIGNRYFKLEEIKII